jgi:hypothetical protein
VTAPEKHGMNRDRPWPALLCVPTARRKPSTARGVLLRVDRMKRITYGNRSVLIGDTAAHALIAYGTALANVGRADQVTLSVLEGGDAAHEVTFVLSRGMSLSSESSAFTLPEPDNTDVVAILEDRTALLAGDHRAVFEPDAPDPWTGINDY